MPLPFSDWPVPKKEVNQNVIQIYLGRSDGISHFYYDSPEGLRRMCDDLIFQGNTGIDEAYERCPPCRELYAAGVERLMIYDPLDPKTWLDIGVDKTVVK